MALTSLILTLYHKSLLLTTLRKDPFENIVGKEENAGNQHFSFPTMFPTLSKVVKIFSSTFSFSSVNTFSLVQSKIMSFGKE